MVHSSIITVAVRDAAAQLASLTLGKQGSHWFICQQGATAVHNAEVRLMTLCGDQACTELTYAVNCVGLEDMYVSKCLDLHSVLAGLCGHMLIACKTCHSLYSLYFGQPIP